MPCTAASPSAHPPIDATQALSVIPVRVLADVPVSAAILKLGQVSCVTVGVGQTVSIEVAARVPPRPAEARAGSPLLSRITLSPAVPSAAAAPRSGRYRLTFTAQAAGATMITYLAATCTLPPGVC
ncbi:MAG: hypothetical protein ACRENL_04520 [Candidatus Dormibacteria bacterium]